MSHPDILRPTYSCIFTFILQRSYRWPSSAACIISHRVPSSLVLLQETSEATRKSIEAKGIAQFQTIVSEGISPQLLEWKGIEATEALSHSNNAKVVVIGNAKNGLPLIFGDSSNASPRPYTPHQATQPSKLETLPRRLGLKTE